MELVVCTQKSCVHTEEVVLPKKQKPSLLEMSNVILLVFLYEGGDRYRSLRTFYGNWKLSLKALE